MALDQLARRVVRAYRGLGWRHHPHVWVRWHSCPFPAVAARVPEDGRILDLGCGHGSFALYLSCASPARTVVGVDVDGRKLEVARAAATRLGASVAFDQVTTGWRPTPAWDAITVVDVLYLLGRDAAMATIDAAIDALAPGGSLLVKEVDVTPRWKLRLSHAQEILATRVTRVTKGDVVDIVPASEFVARCEARGLTVERVQLDRPRLHPHYLIVAIAATNASTSSGVL
ncbi:MAG: class I SAM-dependent methyltransferase [Chloroflexi bacterium]|nr:class I SAM-dependent methyltransferase [Chloroflexota bacterium]